MPQAAAAPSAEPGRETDEDLVHAFVQYLYAGEPMDGVEVAAAGSSTGILDGLGIDQWLAVGP